ncbi:MAG: AAA family ATPase [Bdellovibrionaceae bacterium]|nr:AAA family ATPase [Pseudobdellovibrionaceae bacterium]
MSQCCRIVVTGGPGGGKTTAADLFRRELGEQVLVVPEAATLLFRGGFPRSEKIQVIKPSQQAIYHVQRNLEDAQSAIFGQRILICDRGTVDGAAYWPGDPDEFFATVRSSLHDELSRYDAVLFFETAAVGGLSIEGGNPVRIESLPQAIALDKRLKNLWSQHPNFNFVPHNPSFMKKINQALDCLTHLVHKLNQ